MIEHELQAVLRLSAKLLGIQDHDIDPQPLPRDRMISTGLTCRSHHSTISPVWPIASRHRAAISSISRRELQTGSRAACRWPGNILVDDRTFWTHSAERGSLALQITQILGRLLASLDRAARRENARKLDQGRCAAQSVTDHPTIAPILIKKTQGADATEVIDQRQRSNATAFENSGSYRG